MNQIKPFRCPFERKAEQDGMILEVTLPEVSEVRMELLQHGLKSFYENLELVGLKFIMPESILTSVSSLQELKKAMIPYQCELATAELTVRLSPFLYPYQAIQFSDFELEKLMVQRKHQMIIAKTFISCMIEEMLPEPKAIADVYHVIERLLVNAKRSNSEDQAIHLFNYVGMPKKKVPLGLISLSGVSFYPEQLLHGTNKKENKNSFMIVKSPFYPEAFPRYSSRIEMVFSREADYNAMPTIHRQNIRQQTNEILQAHGVIINDLLNDKQPHGIWIPEYKEEVVH